MKLSFTTLSCPKWDLDTIISYAQKYGYHGIDFRGYLDEMNVYSCPEFSSKRNETLQKITDAGLEVPCFSSSVTMFYNTEEKKRTNLIELEEYLELCSVFRARYIRIFGGRIEDTPREQAQQVALENLEQMAERARASNVELVVETHDDFIRSDSLKPIFEKVTATNVGILWDVHHPFRFHGEDPFYTWGKIGKWVKYTHWKDSALTNPMENKYKLTLMGSGDVPLKDIMRCLIDGGYKGYLAYEWEKRWHPDIEEPEQAIPHYAQYMKSIAPLS